MFPFMTPAQALQLSLRTAVMLAEANMVIGMRMLGLMGMWRTDPGERVRMPSEKLRAAQAGGLAMTAAAAGGKSPARIAAAGLAPVARATRSNARRLAARGPGTPS